MNKNYKEFLKDTKITELQSFNNLIWCIFVKNRCNISAFKIIA